MTVPDTLINTRVNATFPLLSINQRKSYDSQPSFNTLYSSSLLSKGQFGPCMKRIKRQLCACSVKSDFFRHHGLQPTRLLSSWNFPGKNTRMGCHFLLQGIFLTQGSNPSLLHYLHWQADSLPIVPPGKPQRGSCNRGKARAAENEGVTAIVGSMPWTARSTRAESQGEKRCNHNLYICISQQLFQKKASKEIVLFIKMIFDLGAMFLQPHYSSRTGPYGSGFNDHTRIVQ